MFRGSNRKLSTVIISIHHYRYITSGILRLEKADLDGACSDSRFDSDFLIDLIFAPLENSNDVRGNVRDNDVRTVEESKMKTKGVEEGASINPEINPSQLIGEKGKKEKDEEKGQGKDGGLGEGGASVADGEDGGTHLTPINAAPQQPSDGGWTLDLASTKEFQESSQRDFQFWDAVAARKNKSKTKRSRKFSSTPNREGQFSILDEMRGSNDSDSGSFLKVSSSEIPNLGLGPLPHGKEDFFFL
jgi:hypothetical protein